MTVYRMVEDGTLEGRRFGARSLRITRASVKKLMGETWPEPEPPPDSAGT
jgi:excisionase family DNA binding protein